MSATVVLSFYQKPGLNDEKLAKTLEKLKIVENNLIDIETEYCFYVNCLENLSDNEEEKLKWILSPSFRGKVEKETSNLRAKALTEKNSLFIEIGPRLNFSTSFSTNATSICAAVALDKKINRIERSILYLLKYKGNVEEESVAKMLEVLHDRMTEQRYLQPIRTFELPLTSLKWFEIDVINRGSDALRNISNELGLSFDEWDIEYYTKLFRDTLKRNPTSVECFDLAQSNSEHSRHWFFKGRFIVNGNELSKSLIEMVSDTQKHTNQNNVIKFNDNSSAIKGFSGLNILLPVNSTEASLMKTKQNATRHLIFTAETHNFPTGVSPFPGATTGTGGRIRDVHATGRGAHVIAGTAGYCFGNLLIPEYTLEWEDKNQVYPKNFALPLKICIEASNGASDYGNKFGEPVVAGFARSFGIKLPNRERIEWIKPIMFSGGIGTIDDQYINKEKVDTEMLVTKIGGPVYRIGVGGGAASSTHVQGDTQNEELDFGAVQRGDAEMEQKLNRLIRACIEYDGVNPIRSIHDQGAGGNGNVLKEIVDPLGAIIESNKFSLADPTINILELWGAEYQESDAILIKSEDIDVIKKISRREKCAVDIVGSVTGDRHITLIDSTTNQKAVHLDLELVLGSMPPKCYTLQRSEHYLTEFKLPKDVTIDIALNRVLRLPAVGSHAYLTRKVDRSVTGLVAQQQCIGPLHTPLADYAVIAINYYNLCGGATSIGEQPLKGLISPAANGRLSVAEAITNLMFCVITDLADVKCSANWMWAAKLPGEGIKLVDTLIAMCNLMNELNIGIDGGKDSLSMAAKVTLKNDSEIVKSPGTLVISAYAPVPDITVKVTPVLTVDNCKLLYINLSGSDKLRISASALCQVFGQIGDTSPDLDKPQLLKKCFYLVQDLISRKICTAGHDISDGGVITCLLEMAFATNCGIDAHFTAKYNTDIEFLFAEECGIIIEVQQQYLSQVIHEFNNIEIEPQVIGNGLLNQDVISININNNNVLKKPMSELRDLWEETSFELEKYQTNPECVLAEKEGLKQRKCPQWKLTFDPTEIYINIDSHFASAPRVVVLREEGINGDREMIASLYMVGFEVADVTITDLLSDRNITLDAFRGIVFPGGFSYADVLGSAKGWAATMKFNAKIEEQLRRFKARSDTFSLGVCNGCQLMALLGWVANTSDGTQGAFLTENDSGRYESRFVSVRIERNTKAIMFKDMDETIMGVWIAHTEGKFVFKQQLLLQSIENENCIALRYVDDDGNQTIRYPMNPNGSPAGIAAICSWNGRHLAMMPHPERSTFLWQWPHLPNNWKSLQVSPWCKMFRNAYEWCVSS